MKELHLGQFDVLALALPRGHGFGERGLVEGWVSDDDQSFGVVTGRGAAGDMGILVARRREDKVWTVTCEMAGFAELGQARDRLAVELRNGQPAEPLPSGIPRRRPLHDFGGRAVSETFKLLSNPTHVNALWLFNQLYLSLPRPDPNWVSDCQAGNFHARLWEVHLLACFREQGLLVTQPFEAPDFRIENRRGDAAWVEAVTANFPLPYEHVNAPQAPQPETLEELFFGAAALRFAKTLGNKLEKRYDLRPHVSGAPFALAIADFQSGGSMIWSRSALFAYLTGFGAMVQTIDGRREAVTLTRDHLLGSSGFRAGLFTDDRQSELSAVIFSNSCSLGKLNRMAISSGAPSHGYRYVRYGTMGDRTRGALDPIPFCLDITSDAYGSLWDYGHETWNAELEVIHNPFARQPLPDSLLKEATHWKLVNGKWESRRHYRTNILKSRTLILRQSDPMPSLPEMLSMLDGPSIDVLSDGTELDA